MPARLRDMPAALVHDATAAEGGLKAVWSLGAGAFYRFQFADDTEFVVDEQATRIWAERPGSVTLEDTTTYLLGPILGFVLRRRGFVCLHAGAIAVAGRAVAILGPAGQGKSTLVAAFAARGHPVLTDDILALLDDGDAFRIQPGYPMVRLWPDSVAVLFGSPEALPRLCPRHPTWDKRYLALNRDPYRFQAEPLPLAAIYTAAEQSDGAPVFEAIRGQDALATLLGNTYARRGLDKRRQAQEFDVLGRVALRVPLRRYRARRSLADLDALCDAIVKDVHSFLA